MKWITLALVLTAGSALADKPGDYREYLADPDFYLLRYTGAVNERLKPKIAVSQRRPILLEKPVVSEAGRDTLNSFDAKR